jgi:hypothetical protein
MNNPFKSSEFLLPIASINRLMVKEQVAINQFSPKLIINDILKFADYEHLKDDDSVLNIFDSLIFSDERLYEMANKYAISFRNILMVLIEPTPKDKENNLHWQESHFSYWQQIKHIYVVGGLVLPNFKKVLTRVFSDLSNLVSFVENSSDYATLGLAKLIDNEEALIFDFGQTKIKSRYLKNGVNRVLEKTNSKYLYDDLEISQSTRMLDEYIKLVISNKIKETNFKGSKILLAMSNYVNHGIVNKAAYGYGRLGFLDDDYQRNLRNYFSDKLNKAVQVSLFHDTSAMALNFRAVTKVAVISVGTAFGVGFTD